MKAGIIWFATIAAKGLMKQFLSSALIVIEIMHYLFSSWYIVLLYFSFCDVC